MNPAPSSQTQTPPDWQPGHQLLGDYEVIRVLGEGGMGKVYLVRSLSSGSQFAVKRAKGMREADRKAFLTELQTWIDLPDHPNLVPCRFFRTVDTEVLIFAEYVDGGSLKDWIDSRKLYEGGSEQALERMLDVAKLIGSPPGYVGHDEGGQLSDAIRTHPYSVVLFDEIEKAHPRVLDLFLQIFDEGTLTNAQGRKCDFRESVIILTSNLGTGQMRRKMGFGMEQEGGGQDARATEDEAIRRHLRPELVNRLTRIVHFKPLGMETVREILGKIVRELNDRLADAVIAVPPQISGGGTPPAQPAAGRGSHAHVRGVAVELDESAEELILREGYSEEYGARNLERVMDRLLGTPIAEALLSGKITAGQALRVVAEGESLRFLPQ